MAEGASGRRSPERLVDEHHHDAATGLVELAGVDPPRRRLLDGGGLAGRPGDGDPPVAVVRSALAGGGAALPGERAEALDALAIPGITLVGPMS